MWGLYTGGDTRICFTAKETTFDQQHEMEDSFVPGAALLIDSPLLLRNVLLFHIRLPWNCY